MDTAEKSTPPGPAARPTKRAARRPKWLPAEFARPEELAEAYAALKSAPEERAPIAEPALTPQAVAPEPASAPTAPEPVYPGDGPQRVEAAPVSMEARATLDFTPYEKEFCETGGLCEASYASLQALGAPRWLVDRHIEGRLAVAEAARREILELIGGEERFATIRAWARETLSASELAAFDKSVAGSKEEAKFAILGLAAAYDRAIGEAPRLVGGGAGPTTSGPFSNADELAQAIRDPRYRTDPAYRAEVVARLAQRRVFE